jgi:hypothetical protein
MMLSSRYLLAELSMRASFHPLRSVMLVMRLRWRVFLPHLDHDGAVLDPLGLAVLVNCPVDERVGRRARLADLLQVALRDQAPQVFRVDQVQGGD